MGESQAELVICWLLYQWGQKYGVKHRAKAGRWNNRRPVQTCSLCCDATRFFSFPICKMWALTDESADRLKNVRNTSTVCWAVHYKLNFRPWGSKRLKIGHCIINISGYAHFINGNHTQMCCTSTWKQVYFVEVVLQNLTENNTLHQWRGAQSSNTNGHVTETGAPSPGRSNINIVQHMDGHVSALSACLSGRGGLGEHECSWSRRGDHLCESASCQSETLCIRALFIYIWSDWTSSWDLNWKRGRFGIQKSF